MKKKSLYICNQCTHEQAKWLGRCPSCNQYNTLEEVEITAALPGGAGAAKKSAGAKTVKSARSGARLLSEISAGSEDFLRKKTGISELDRVLGGGIVAGSMLLLGGDPGIGKSTLLLQMCKEMAREDFRVLYVSGEESAAQIKMRAERLGVDAAGCYLLAETDIYAIRDAVLEIKPALLLIDSIQTMRLSDLTSLPGSVTQVRECAAFFTTLAKDGEIRQTESGRRNASDNTDVQRMTNMSCVLVGHVTKEGAFAGPRVLEHMVDTVLYFEGDDRNTARMIRAVKNRFGSTHEIGVFEMGERGLAGIEDPSAYMLAGRPAGSAGSVVTCSMEGTRPLLTEVQALTAYTNFGTPRRTGTGMDYNRMVMLMAVLEKRAGYKLQNFDAYVNIAGGLRVDEPAADAAVIAALASCYKEKPIHAKIMVTGEVGLAGELRAISRPEIRVAEAARHGFSACVLPAANKKNVAVPEGFRILGAANIGEMLGAIL
ncbi:MAG: DNA repair protein RadA [Defluviitaleaceae bacterium]|nr:DNA repair protein RadA [Defluviitaleaceae bacterium]